MTRSGAFIEDHALIGDMRTAALVTRDGCVDWFCAPRFDSPAALAALVGDESNGQWALAPVAPAVATRAYVDETMVASTTWSCATGVVRVLDFMPPSGPGPAICRIVEGLSGRVEMRSKLSVRFDYGRTVPWVRRANGTTTQLTAGPDTLWLTGPVRARGVGRTSVTDFAVSAGERASMALVWTSSQQMTRPLLDAEAALASTLRYWEVWVSACTYNGPWRDAVVRSLLTLKALTFAETGGIVAAPTTSLPEVVGGARNWDYRYCWLRDAALTLRAFLECGFVEEAYGWREWLARAVGGRPADLQIAYSLDGGRRMPEYELAHLAGYGQSHPVRIGNAAAEQSQLDVYGEVLGALALARRMGLPQPAGLGSLQRLLLDHLATAWRAPDEGIWEVRSRRRHFVHSKVLAWSAFDGALRAAAAGTMRGPTGRWAASAEAIAAEVLRCGWDSSRGTFTAAYGAPDLDAALLLLPQVGFLPGDDPRVLGTIRAIEAELVDDAGLVRRYRTGDGADGLEGDEGAFVACSFWLVDALAGAGRADEAAERFERLLGLRNDLGLLAEEYDPASGHQLGNFPQAFSHLALVGSALALGDARTPGRVPAASER